MTRRLAWLAAFAAAMAYLESAVVVYLREIYYPRGFSFPIVIIPDRMAAIEVGREAATIAMLLAVGVLAGADRWERFLAFAFAFGVWDVCYYAWLWVLLRWPPSLTTWDILFLIPVPWIGPVLAPILVSAGLSAGSWWLLRLKSRGVGIGFPAWIWALAVAGGVLTLLSFTLDFRVALEGRDPPPFRWGLFASGCLLGVVALVLGVRRLAARERIAVS